MPDEPKIDWNIPLDFETPAPKVETPPPEPKRPPREVIQEKFPRILDKINQQWGSMALHKYFQETLMTDRAGRQGFPADVMAALGELHVEHQRLLMRHGLLRVDVWDMQFSDAVMGYKKP